MNESSGTEQPSSDSLRETVLSIVGRHLPTAPKTAQAIVNQLMYVIPETPVPVPITTDTPDQMQEMINLAYQLGWKDRDQAVWPKDPPTVTLQYEPGVRTTFLYDGKPRP